MSRAESPSRLLAAVAIALAHGIAIHAIAAWSPLVDSPLNTPLEVQFISLAESRPLPPTPHVDIVAPAVVSPVPEIPVTEMPATETADRAITVDASAAPAPPSPRGSAPKLISQVEYVEEPSPRYPAQSRRLREQGLVVLRVEIDEQGLACNIQIESSSGHARLDEAAREAVSRAVFRPYVEDGEPRRALVLIPIEFSLARTTVRQARA